MESKLNQVKVLGEMRETVWAPNSGIPEASGATLYFVLNIDGLLAINKY